MKIEQILQTKPAKTLLLKGSSFTKILFIGFIGLCFTPWVSSPVALVAGFLFTWVLGNPFASLTGRMTGWLLKISVVGLGFGMNLQSALHTGAEGFWLTVASIATVLTLGYILGRCFKMIPRTSHLVACGTAICGGSAIAAVAPVIKANPNDISVSLGIVFLLNSLALIIFPQVGHVLSLSQEEFGLWSAIAIHDTSSVVGAASAYGDKALEVATTVKLARALWIIPVCILSAFLFKNGSKKISIPWFIFFFILAMIASTYLPVLSYVSGGVNLISKKMLVVTLFLIGAGLSVDKIKSVGIKPLFQGVILWVFISIASLLAILFHVF